MAKIVGGKFTVRWSKSISPDVVGYVLFFGDTNVVNYNSPFVSIPGPDTEVFNFPQDAPGFNPPVDEANEKLYVMIVAEDDVGNLSDPSVVLEVPFDATPPAPPSDFRLG